MKILLLILIIFAGFSCAKKSQNVDEYVRCQVMFGAGNDSDNLRFYDIDRGYFVDVATCDEVHPTDTVQAF